MKSILTCAVLAVVAVLAPAAPAAAQTRIGGTFLARQACPAVQSIRKQTNPGNVALVPGTSYKLIGGNKADATYYWIVVPTAAPDFRWVPVACGTPTLDTADTTTQAPPKSAPAVPGKADYVLAISWEPAFCEGLPDKTECKRQTAGSYEATHFALHGLWPQPRSKAYCSVSAANQASDKAHDWAALPPVDLPLAMRAVLDKAMPGTQSLLERHEWIVHGTCSGATPDAYFSRAVQLLDTINSYAVGNLFAQNIGKRLDSATIRQAFDTAFGPGAGDRVRLACDQDGDRRLISEITVGLRGDVIGTSGVADLIAASAPTDPGCTGGIVDPVGLQ